MTDIQKKILDKLEKNFSVRLTEDLYNTSFFNPKVGLVARNFIDLVYEVELEFGIMFDEKIMIDHEFCTFVGFVKAIKERGVC